MAIDIGSALAYIVSSSAIASVVSFGANKLWEYRTTERQRNKDAAYLAMQLAVILEAFVIKCMFKDYHNTEELGEGGHELEIDLPQLEAFPRDSDWKSIDPVLAERAMSFPNKIASANESSLFESLREGNKIASASKLAPIAAVALALATDLRRRYSIAPAKIDNVDKFLKKEELRKVKQQEYIAGLNVQRRGNTT